MSVFYNDFLLPTWKFAKKNMKANFLVVLLFAFSAGAFSQNLLTSKTGKMKMNAGIITSKLEETRRFYTEVLGFGITFQNEFYLLLHTPDKQAELSFLQPDHPSQQPLFHPAFNGKGVYLTIEVEQVDQWYQKLKKLGIEIKIDLRSEPWGDRHFAIQDPNGIGIDIVTYTEPQK
jgi:catechol 2,3-dioxygenase-like lactoylglutathione lyase family enzyme